MAFRNLIVSCEWSENDDKMVDDYVEQSKEMFEKAGFINIKAKIPSHHRVLIFMKWVVYEWEMIQKLLS